MKYFLQKYLSSSSGKDWVRVLKSGVLPAENLHIAG
jgi:hypothetical protein